MGHDRAEVVPAVHKFDASLDVIFMVGAQHQSRLVETGLVVSGYFHLYFKFPSAQCV